MSRAVTVSSSSFSSLSSRKLHPCLYISVPKQETLTQTARIGESDELAPASTCHENMLELWTAQSKDLNHVRLAAMQNKRSIDNLQVMKPSGEDGKSAFRASANSFPQDRKRMEVERLARPVKRKRESPKPPPAPPVFKLINYMEDDGECWRMGETVDAFLSRLPPLQTSADEFPWIWVENPYKGLKDMPPAPSVSEFIEQGEELLKHSLENRQEILTGDQKGRKTTLLHEEGKALQQRLTDLAKEHDVLSGKVCSIHDTYDRYFPNISFNVIIVDVLPEAQQVAACMENCR